MIKFRISTLIDVPKMPRLRFLYFFNYYFGHLQTTLYVHIGRRKGKSTTNVRIIKNQLYIIVGNN